MSSMTMAGDRRLTKHGFPKGFRFVPTQLELITILSLVIHGRRLHPKVAAIFHELNILDYHPDELHGMYERYKEHRYIYFFSYRQRQNQNQKSAEGGPAHKKRQRGAGGQDEDDNGPRPVRMARGGGWKPSGGGIEVCWPKDKGGFIAGKTVTMVFYDHHDDKIKKQAKSQWAMHEFTVPLNPRVLPKPDNTTTRLPLHNLALYRLYKVKSDGMERDCDRAGSNQTPANVAAADGRHFSAPCPAGQPSFGIFNGQNQPLTAGASSSRMPPPQLQQHRIPNLGHPQYYHHHQYTFGGARASAAHQQVRAMTMPPAYGAGMLPGRQLSQYARPPGTWLPDHQSLQFARPPAPSQMPALPVAANPASTHQQAPAKAMYGGAGQEASHSGATRSLLPLATAPAAPLAEALAPMTAATHGGAGGQNAGCDFGATCSSPATGSRPAEQGATATAEPGQHVQCVNPEETVPPPTPADNNDGIGMLDYDINSGVYSDNCLFTMYELFGDNFLFDEPPPTQQGDDN